MVICAESNQRKVAEYAPRAADMPVRSVTGPGTSVEAAPGHAVRPPASLGFAPDLVHDEARRTLGRAVFSGGERNDRCCDGQQYWRQDSPWRRASD